MRSTKGNKLQTIKGLVEKYRETGNQDYVLELYGILLPDINNIIESNGWSAYGDDFRQEAYLTLVKYASSSIIPNNSFSGYFKMNLKDRLMDLAYEYKYEVHIPPSRRNNIIKKHLNGELTDFEVTSRADKDLGLDVIVEVIVSVSQRKLVLC